MRLVGSFTQRDQLFKFELCSIKKFKFEIQQGCGRQEFRVAWIDFEQQGELLSSTCVVTLGAQQAGILQPQLLIGGKGGNAVFQSLQRIGQGLIELELCPQHDGANILRRAL